MIGSERLATAPNHAIRICAAMVLSGGVMWMSHLIGARETDGDVSAAQRVNARHAAAVAIDNQTREQAHQMVLAGYTSGEQPLTPPDLNRTNLGNIVPENDISRMRQESTRHAKDARYAAFLSLAGALALGVRGLRQKTGDNKPQTPAEDEDPDTHTFAWFDNFCDLPKDTPVYNPQTHHTESPAGRPSWPRRPLQEAAKLTLFSPKPPESDTAT